MLKRMGKLNYLDEVWNIQERWDIFFASFRLLGTLNPEFVQQCQDFLESLGLTEDPYWNLLRLAHERMRQEAEREQNDLGVEAASV